jgi:hypothetical protein
MYTEYYEWITEHANTTIFEVMGTPFRGDHDWMWYDLGRYAVPSKALKVVFTQ